MAAVRASTLHPPPFILHSSSSTLHPPPFILHPPSSTLHPPPFILHPPSSTLHPPPSSSTLHPPPSILHPSSSTFILHPPSSTLHPPPSILHPSSSTLHPPPFILHPSPSTFILHPSSSTFILHPSSSTPHPPPFTLHLHPPPFILHPSSSTLHPPPSILHPSSSTFILHPPSSTLHPPPSILHPSSSTLHPPPFILHPPSSTLHPPPFILHPSSSTFILHPSSSTFILHPSSSTLHHMVTSLLSPNTHIELHLLTLTLTHLTTNYYETCRMGLNCTELDDVLERYYLSPFYAIQFCIGFPGNLLVILGYIFCLPAWQSCNVYLFSLAVSDLLFLCTLPRLSYLYANDQSESSPVGCVVNRYILHVNLYSSILFMVLLSMDRFLLIRHPTRSHYLLRPRAALLVTGLSWLLVNVQVAPMIFLMLQDLQTGNWSRCKDFASLKGDISSLGYSLGLTLTGYVLPLVGLCVFSYQIGHLLRVQERAVQRRTTSYKRPLRVAASAAIMFLVIYSPYHLLRNVRIASVQAWAGLPLCTTMYIEAAYIITRPLAFLHSVINPVFYFFMGDKFRELLLTRFRKLVRKKENLPQREPA
ncbi:succinate receptor 1-like [Centropristis striata]|uniref:succinate receptor 1-like n=1 Tax=Centropristis striata TaxID=184440 RepID=UPI0027DEC0E7|nr:succinate receptor 1-like [Centropristis striata]